MPFTLAHPALVLPLRDRGLPMAALVAGSIVPDSPQILGFSHVRDLSHSLLGVVTIDLALAMIALVLWYALYRRPLADVALDPWRDRLPDQAPMTVRGWALSVPAVVIGSLTHVAWDAFTHDDGWFVEHLSALRAAAGGVAVYDLLQWVSSVAGLVVIYVATGRHLKGLPRRSRRPAPLVGRWSLVVALTSAALLGMLVSVLVAPYGAEAAIYYLAVTPMLVAGFGITCICVWWQLKRLIKRVGLVRSDRDPDSVPRC